PGSRARDARLPAGGDRAGLPAPPIPARNPAAGLRGPRTASRGADPRRASVHRLSRTGGTHAMTQPPAQPPTLESDSNANTRMLTALVRLRGSLQATRLPRDVPG